MVSITSLCSLILDHIYCIFISYISWTSKPWEEVFRWLWSYRYTTTTHLTFNLSCFKHDALTFCGYTRWLHTVSIYQFWSAYHLTSSCVASPKDQDWLLAAGLRVPVDPHRRRTSFLLLSCNQTLSHYVNPDSNPTEFETVNPFFRWHLTSHSDCRSSLFLPKWANGNYTDLRINTYCTGKCWT